MNHSPGNAFGIKPEQRTVTIGWATTLTPAELHQMELKDKAKAEADKELASQKSMAVRGRVQSLNAQVADEEPGPLRDFALEHIEAHKPIRWDGGRFYHPVCDTCIEPDWDWGTRAPWPCAEFESLERVYQ